MELIDKLPSFYNNDITKPIQDALNIEANILVEEVQNLLNQCLSVDNATSYLPYWENMLGINSNNLDIQSRQENVKAKLRTKGTSTLTTIKNICEAYSNGQVNIIMNSANYSFVIDFVNTLGFPSAFNELDRTISEIKPCHLAHTYKINFNTYKTLSSFTYAQLKTHTNKQLREVIL